MGYMLPLRFIKVSQKNDGNGQCDVAICATRIVAIMSTDAYQARRTIKDEKKAGTLINAAGKNAVKSAIFLDNGSVVASPLTVTRLMTAIEKSNFRKSRPKRRSVQETDDDDDQEVTAEDDEQDNGFVLEEILEENGDLEQDRNDEDDE